MGFLGKVSSKGGSQGGAEGAQCSHFPETGYSIRALFVFGIVTGDYVSGDLYSQGSVKDDLEHAV